MHPQRFASLSRVFAALVIGIPIILYFIVAFTTPGLHLSNLHYNPYLFIPAVSLVIDLILLGIMLRKPMHSEEMLWLVVYMLLYAIIAATELLTRISASPTAAVFWMRATAPESLLPPVLLLFAFTYTNRSARRLNALTAFLIICGLLYVTYSLLLFPNSIDLLKYTIRQPWGWDTSGKYGPPAVLGPIPLTWYLAATGIAIARLLSFRRHTKNVILRRQSLVFVLGAAMPIVAAITIGSISNLFPNTTFPSLTTPTSVLSAAILLYGIYRYQLLTISPTQFSETILNLMQESVVVLDKNGTMLYINPAAKKQLNIANLEKQQLAFTSILSPESVATFKHAQAASTNNVFTINQLDIFPHHNKPLPVRVSSSRLRLTDFEAWVMVLTDISAGLERQKVIEHEVAVRTHELHQARANLVASISSLQQGFLLVDATGKVELANHRMATMLHMVETHIAGHAVSDLRVGTSWSTDLEHAITHALNNQRSKKFDTFDEDGTYYRTYITPVLLNNRPIGATIVIEDQTEQKVLQRSKDEFFSIASHELRTPLTAIRGNMSIAQEYFGEALKDPALRELLADTHAASVRLIEIVNDFLDSSKLEQGKMVFTMAPVNIAPLINAVLGDLKVLNDQQGNQIVLDSSLEKLPLVNADEGRLRQILYNMLSNANKYCEHGTITISGGVEARKVYLRVADTGRGISVENQKLLFHKFQQAGTSILTRDNTKGTGLGLYISRLLAVNMKGNVVLESSTEGKGSVFRLVLAQEKEQ